MKSITLISRKQITHLLVAVLVGTFFVPVTQMAVPGLREQASAAVTNGSMQLSSGGQQQINIPGGGINPTTGVTFESWINFSNIASTNQIFRSWTFSSSSRVIDLTWSSAGLLSWFPDQLGGSSCTVNTKAPVANTWYNLSLVVDPYVNQGAGTSKIFLNGNLLRNCRLGFMRQNGNIQGVQLGGSVGQMMKVSAVRVSSTAQYSKTYSQNMTHPTTSNSAVWALYNTIYDDSIANSCLTNSDPGAKGSTLTTVSGSVSCSNSSPTAPTTPINGSINLPSGVSAQIGRFAGGNTTVPSGEFKLDPRSGWTWEGWIKFSSIGSGYNTIFAGCANGTVCSSLPNSNLSWRGSDGAFNFNACTNVGTGVIPTTGKWYHIAVSTAPSVAQQSGGAATNNYLFIDGLRVATCTQTQYINGSWEVLIMGGSAGLAMKVGPVRFRSGQQYIANFTPPTTYPTIDSTAWILLNTQYDNYDLCFNNTDPINKQGLYNIVGTASCSNDAPAAIAAAQAALTLSSTAGTYGTTLRLTTTGGSGTGAVTFVTGSAGCSITNTDSLTVNSALTCSVTATKAADSNFTAISSSATNIVFAVRPITIKAAAKSATFTGSSVLVSNSYSITSGTLAGSDTFTALTYTYSSGSYSASQTAPSSAGSYTITPSAAAFSVGLASNYSITYETATLTISKANQSALTITTTTSTYGTPLRLITSGGSGTGALSFAVTSSGTASGCSINNETITAGSFGTCRVTATKATDTNYLVISSIETVITFSKAETITVTTTLSSNSVIYNELPANVTVTQTVTGLVNSDTPTVTATYTLQSCQSGGTCAIGDIAPGGGYVFYVSATPINVATGVSTGGIYLATAPQTWYTGAIDPTASWGCSGTDISGTSEAVGAGAQNTWLNTVGCATAGRASRLAADSSAEGFTDWFMPSIGELNLMYSNLKLSNLSNLDGSFYWSSTQNASNPAASATYVAFTGGGVATADKTSVFSVRPIRAFSPTAVAVNTLPTDVGTYAVVPTLTLSSPASLSNYQAVEYVGTTLTINKARQRALTVGQYDAYPGISTYPLNIYGGSGPGVITRSLASGGSAGCSMVQGLFVTAATVGTCDVRVEKAGTLNYFAESTTATIYWMTFVNRYIPSVPATPADFGLSGSVAIEKRSYETFTVSSFANGSGSAVTSVAMNSVMRIIGTGFNSSDETTEVIIGFSSIPKSSLTFNTSNPAANYVQFTVPNDLDLGANDVAMKSRKGWAFASGLLTVTEPSA